MLCHFGLAIRMLSKYPFPIDKIRFQYSRSSGPGGQHVNKTESKVEARIDLSVFREGFPEYVYPQILDRNKSIINKLGELIVTSQVHREQHMNKQETIQKLQCILDDSSDPPKKAKKAKKEPAWAKEKRVNCKRKESKLEGIKYDEIL